MSSHASDAESDRSSRAVTTGRLAEQLVAQWLQQQNWQILEQRWHCRWGELDVIALQPQRSCLAFVEVKARSRGNWDADGLLAIPLRKQEKLGLAAQVFLATYPNYAQWPCRFDVAAVRVQPVSQTTRSGSSAIQIGKPVVQDGYVLTLLHYIPSAFDVVGA
jgi:putative endonuclease